ncbi:MAG: hypothetical protein QOG75_6856 [Mycobacterium sp.]|nr:hypothetical protein [Mycobacterium sp.]
MPRLLGMRLDAVTLEQAVERVVDASARGQGGTVLTPNVDILYRYRSTPEWHPVFEHTDLLVADGMPLVVASRIQGTPVPEQITGPTMVRALSEAAARSNLSVILAGGGLNGEADKAAARLREIAPGLRVQTHPCYVEPENVADELAKLAQALTEAQPEIVFIGLPFDTQISVMTDMAPQLPGIWFIGVGSSYDVISGDRTDPDWVERWCLAWLWRLRRQPWMWRRFLRDDLPTGLHLWADALAKRLKQHFVTASVSPAKSEAR